MSQRLKTIFFLFALALFETRMAFAEATSMSDLDSFLEQVGDFLITIVGPGILVIGVAVAEIS